MGAKPGWARTVFMTADDHIVIQIKMVSDSVTIPVQCQSRDLTTSIAAWHVTARVAPFARDRRNVRILNTCATSTERCQ